MTVNTVTYLDNDHSRRIEATVPAAALLLPPQMPFSFTYASSFPPTATLEN